MRRAPPARGERLSVWRVQRVNTRQRLWFARTSHSLAHELDAVVVSNDGFKDRVKALLDAREPVIRYMIVNGEVVLERRTRKRD